MSPDAAGSAESPQPMNDVEAQWELLRLVERIEPGPARRLLSDRLRAEEKHAEGLRPLDYWPALPRRNYELYQDTGGRVRLRRILDFVRPRDQVVEIGCGFGYVAGVLMRDAEVEHYCGLDIEPRYLRGAEEMARVNGLPLSRMEFHRQDLFTLDAEFMARSEPTLILALEVLEHVPEPERALRVLAQATPPSAPILLSVPLEGRMEANWGHLSIFGADRIRSMCDAAGLEVRHVEPIYNAWAFVLACHPSAPTDRAPAFLTSELGDAAVLTARVFRSVSHDLPASEMKTHWNYRAGSLIEHDDDGHLLCTVTGGSDVSGSQYGGARLPIESPAVLRLELAFTNPDDILAVFVDGYDDDGQRRMRWTWERSDRAAYHTGFRTYVLKPGASSGPFAAVGGATPEEVTSVHVFMRINPGATAGLRVGRVATIPHRA